MEWWKLWVPFGATILGIIANVWINITQNRKQQEFQKEIIDKQQELQKEITKTQIDANLKAKARIEWIKNVRSLASKLICISGDLNKIATVTTNYTLRYIEVKSEAVFESQIVSPTLKYEMENGDENEAFLPEYSDMVQAYFKRADSKKNDFIKNVNELYYTGQELLMYFSESTEHDKIIRLIENMIFTTNRFEETIKNNLTKREKDFEIIESYTTGLDKDIQSFSYEMKKYLKKEWDKAKEGK